MARIKIIIRDTSLFTIFIVISGHFSQVLKRQRKCVVCDNSRCGNLTCFKFVEDFHWRKLWGFVIWFPSFCVTVSGRIYLYFRHIAKFFEIYLNFISSEVISFQFIRFSGCYMCSACCNNANSMYYPHSEFMVQCDFYDKQLTRLKIRNGWTCRVVRVLPHTKSANTDRKKRSWRWTGEVRNISS